jgi:hypothetical protein
MKKTNLIDIQALWKEAENSEHKESYRILERSHDYRIGVAARLEPPHGPSLFLEVLIYLCPNYSEVDVPLLEKNLMFLKELEARGYHLNCQDDTCVSCESAVSPRNFAEEYETVKAMIKRILSTER